MQANHCVFVKKFKRGDFLVLLVYMDNMLIVDQDHMKIGMLKKALSKSFSLKDVGPARQILGMHIVWNWTKRLLWLSHEKYPVSSTFSTTSYPRTMFKNKDKER